MAETVKLRDRFEIDTGARLEEYDLPNAKAYRAIAKRDDHGEFMAYVCEPRVPLRYDDLENLKGTEATGLMRYMDWGVVAWTPQRRRLPVVIYEQPVGKRLVANVADQIEPMSDERIVRGFLTPAMAALRELSAKGIPHRAIRPDNLFFNDNSERTIILGDNLTCPPGLYNPMFVETLEQSMADPIARGRGTITDDLYAVGVCVLFLLLGRNPAHNIEASDLIQRKIYQSSYSTLVSGARVQMNMMELLRGLLSDDTRERWTVREVELWIGGRRLTPKQAKLPHKAARPINIAGVDHENVRSAADGLGRNWLTAGEVITGQDFDNWLRRSLNDERIVDQVTKILGSAAVIQKTTEAEMPRLVTRACLALDPSAPLRHRGFSAHIDGVATALALEFNSEAIREKIADFINGKFVNQWMSLQPRTRSDHTELYSMFDKMPAFIAQPGPGFGLERAMYELNPHMHCLSPLVESYYLTRIEELIPGLELAANKKDRASTPMDRHIAAFIGARSDAVDDRLLRGLNVTERIGTEQTLAALQLLGRVQALSKNKVAPALCRWFMELMSPAVDAYHNLKQRKIVETAVMTAAESGVLMELYNIYADQKTIQRDQQGYTRAQQEHQTCDVQIRQLTTELDNKEHMANELGEQAAAVTSGVIGSIGSTIIIIIFML